MHKPSIRIGGACGYWGETAMATPQFLADGTVDYIVYDYLAEITMSIMARAKSKNPDAGFAADFISAVLKPNIDAVADANIKLLTNAGGLNPAACGAAARALIAKLGLNLKVAVISGDNLITRAQEISVIRPREMFTGEPFPDPVKMASINVYLGAFPIAKALAEGADIVITGRSVDSAVTLGACIYEFGWKRGDLDLLASGSLAGHILECGPQATGGNFTDWELAGDISNIGYPIATIFRDGSFDITKPDGTSGLISIGTICEQMTYEIGDPQAYILPDVVCDFSDVKITSIEKNKVHVSPATGLPPPDTYKTCATFIDGFRTGTSVTFYGFDAAKKGRAFAEAAFKRTRKILRGMNAADFAETSIEILGGDSQFGAFGDEAGAREVTVKIAAKHPTAVEGGLLLKELAGLGLAAAPGLSGFKASGAKPSPVVRLFSYLTQKSDVSIDINIDGVSTPYSDDFGEPFDLNAIARPSPPIAIDDDPGYVSVPLVKLAWGRSGDKGNKANIGIIARKAEYMPFIWSALTPKVVAERFAHFIDSDAAIAEVERYYLPGPNAINFLIDKVLGGGGIASIRNDPQGKGYAQILLAQPIKIPGALARDLT